MITTQSSLWVLSTLAVTLLLGAAACKPAGEAEVIKKMALRNAELDQLDLQAGNPGLPPVRRVAQAVDQDGNPVVYLLPPDGIQDSTP